MMKKLLSLLMLLVLLVSSFPVTAAAKTTPTPPPEPIPEEVLSDVPYEMKNVLEIAYHEWEELGGSRLKEGKPNKFTEWRNKGSWYGWCGGYITWCMLAAGIPQQEWAKTPIGRVEGVCHVKEAGVGKLVTGYSRMYRTTLIPQKGFLVVYGKKGMNGLVHVGLVYDVEKLENGKYRMTTLEGNVNSSIMMFIQDFDPLAPRKPGNLTAVPEEERTREQNAMFSYIHAYSTKKKELKDVYVNMFLMPWVPEEMAE